MAGATGRHIPYGMIEWNETGKGAAEMELDAQPCSTPAGKSQAVSKLAPQGDPC